MTTRSFTQFQRGVWPIAGCDEAGHERSVPECVLPRRAADEALRTEDLVCEVRMAGVHARVDDGDRNRLEGR